MGFDTTIIHSGHVTTLFMHLAFLVTLKRYTVSSYVMNTSIISFVRGAGVNRSRSCI
jgi:hypothetical protein